MGRYGEVVESGEVTYRGFTYTYEIYHDDDAENPLDGMDNPGIWIHDNATRSWGGLAKGESIWSAIDDAKDYPYGAEEAYDAWAQARYDKLVAEYSPRVKMGETLSDSRIVELDGLRTRAKGQARREAYGINTVAEFFERETGGIARVLYGFEHSGKAVSLSDFNDRWDSGAIGIVYMTPAMIRERMMWKRITKARREQMVKYLAQDIKCIDNWLHGYTYGYVFYDEKGDEPEWNSVWGCYDEWDARYTIESVTEDIKSDIDGRYLDMDVKRVERLVISTGYLLGRMNVDGDVDEDLVNRRMDRLRANVERLPAWRRKQPLAMFDVAYTDAVMHPFVGYIASDTGAIAWDANVTTQYGSIG